MLLLLSRDVQIVQCDHFFLTLNCIDSADVEETLILMHVHMFAYVCLYVCLYVYYLSLNHIRGSITEQY